MKFENFAAAVNKRFDLMTKHDLFRTAAEKDDLWSTYLGSFPEGTNPIYREKTEHDCNCCKSFIRAVGNVVAIINNELVSIWDIKLTDEKDQPYQVVADALSKLVKSKAIANIFLHTEKTAGVAKNYEKLDGGSVQPWTHFFVNIPKKFVDNKEIGSRQGNARALHDVLLRSINEITMDSVDTVLELIGQNSIYRGMEHKFAVSEFKKLKSAPANNLDLFVWSKISNTPESVSKIRNTSIGTLLVDLSEGLDLEDSVKKFEAMVAPENYKRPTALATESMKEAARKTFMELGLTTARDRRYATIEDITINNIIFANRQAKGFMASDDIFDAIPTTTKKKPNYDKVEEVGIEKFLSDILPKAETIEVMMENRHTPNLVSLVAPVDATAPHMFKWDNAFSWSYNGDVADSSIKERVKNAGGNVTGEFCNRLSWEYTDDLDFHMEEPGSYLIYFGTRNNKSPNGGRLDVDANGGSGMMDHPVENIFYEKKSTMRDGVYTLKVNNYNARSGKSDGFVVEVELDGVLYTLEYKKRMKTGETVSVATFTKKGDTITVTPLIDSTTVSKKVWGINTEQFVPVNVVMLSPNYWDGHGVGNKHYFFMMPDCVNEGTARGFYNEFLNAELDKHRKVMELVGSKMQTENSDRQLSGLGFSSTQKNSIMVRVSGSFNRIIKVTF